MAVQTVLAPPRAVLTPASVALPAPVSASSPTDRPNSRFQWWQPGWPLTYLFTGYPLWWLMGLTQAFLLLAAAIMAVQLVRTHRVAARPGFGWWLLFLAWVAVGILLLQVDAPGAQPGASNGRYVTFTYRFCMYLAATTALLYVYNFRSRIPTERIVRAFSWFFVTVAAGGVLGTAAPYLDFPSALELVLPHNFSNIEFVHSLVHPSVAQLNEVNGVVKPRTSAPFPYTNDWGLSYACLLPFFLVAWLGKSAGWRRHAAPWVLLVSLYPVVVSQNRGLWIALVVSGVVVFVRAAVFGNVRFAVAGCGVALAVVAIILSTPLGATIDHRLSNAGSANGRASLGSQTVASVAEKSAVVGLGTTRNAQGSFYSIAGGDNPDCSGCSPPPLGTQGHFWLVVYSAGFGGLLLYLGFVLIQLLRHIRLRSPVGTLGTVVLIVHLSTMFVYDTIGVELVIIFAAIGLLWREKIRMPTGRTQRAPRDPTIGAYASLLRHGVAVVAVSAVLGIGGGLIFQNFRGIQHESITSVIVPVDPSSSIAGGTGHTMDTLAQLVSAPAIHDAVDRVVGERLDPGGSKFFVTAKANTRVLQLHVRSPSGALAERASQLGAMALIDVRAQLLIDQRTDDLRGLERARAASLKAVRTIDALPDRDPSAKPLTGQRNALISNVESIDEQILQLNATRINAGQVLDTPPARAETDAWLVAGCSGLMIGVLVSILILLARHTFGRRFGRTAHRYGDLPVLGRMTYARPNTSAGADAAAHAAAALAPVGSATILSIDDSPLGCSAAAALDDAVDQRYDGANRTRSPIVLVAGPDTTDRALEHAQNGIDAYAAPIAGVVVIDDMSTPERDTSWHRIPWHATRRLRGK